MIPTGKKVQVECVVTAKTVQGAAVQTLVLLTDYAKGLGYRGNLPVYRDRTDGFDAPTVVWEGLYEWAVVLSLQGNMARHEVGLNPYSDDVKPEITFPEGAGWIAEPLNSYSLAFYKN